MKNEETEWPTAAVCAIHAMCNGSPPAHRMTIDAKSCHNELVWVRLAAQRQLNGLDAASLKTNPMEHQNIIKRHDDRRLNARIALYYTDSSSPCDAIPFILLFLFFVLIACSRSFSLSPFIYLSLLLLLFFLSAVVE